MEQRGNYQIKVLKNLGGGGFGSVDLVELFTLSGNLCQGNGHSNGRYARKILSVREDFVGEYYSAEDWRRRFKREVKYQADCKHTNIVQIYIHNLNIENPWFIMELAEDSLKNELLYGIKTQSGEREPLTTEQKIQIIKMILEGVNHMHNKGYFHRDLKPENILRYSDGTYKISDFGLVKNADTRAESEVISNMRVVLGTDEYMSPESKKGLFNEKSDIYSLGVIINHMNLSGIKGIDEIAKISTHFKPADRFNSVAEMLEALDSIKPRSKT